MEDIITCVFCDEELNEEDVVCFDDTLMCRDCFDEQTTICDCCSTRIWNENSEGNSDITLCSHCYEYSYTHCENCNALIHNDDACYDDDSDYPYCRDCYDKIQESCIKSYNYKPEPTFYGSGNLFYGIELEIDKGGEDNAHAEQLLHIANARDNVLYAKHDGSIDNGFELVSEPATIDYHLNEFNWADVLEAAINMGYRSHNTNTCGLHVHCSRSAFGKDRDEQDIAIARIVHFVEKHWNELIKVSRRTQNNLDRWAARYCTIAAEVQETYKKAKEKHLGRYVAVNLDNYSTIEFRLFRGTLRYSTFVATLQLVDEICNLAINLSDKEIESMSWADFVAGIQEKPELIYYLKSKRLYVNECIEETEEM
ncbi:MAG: amidoligase family protein [Eubacteriales bacterium]|nr:amidoligase family protein [Eubacteriales bacterium]